MADKPPGLWYFTTATQMDQDNSLPLIFKLPLKQVHLTSGFPSRCSSVYTACGETQALWASSWTPALSLLGGPTSRPAKPILLFEWLLLGLCSPGPERGKEVISRSPWPTQKAMSQFPQG